jgi:ANTAR domain/PAS fold
MVSPATIPPRAARHAVAGPPRSRPAASAAPPSTGRAGRFRIEPRTTAWWWSPAMYEVLGLPPEDTVPGTQALLQCLHREDRARALAALTRSCTTGQPFALVTRVLPRDAAQRLVTIFGEPCRDPDGQLSAVEGGCVDVTAGALADEDVVGALQVELSQMRTAMASRATIEQAKGILMLLTCCSDQVAFDLLAHMSSHTHRKVREVAAALTTSASGGTPLPDDIRAILRDACPPEQRLH